MLVLAVPGCAFITRLFFGHELYMVIHGGEIPRNDSGNPNGNWRLDFHAHPHGVVTMATWTQFCIEDHRNRAMARHSEMGGPEVLSELSWVKMGLSWVIYKGL